MPLTSQRAYVTTLILSLLAFLLALATFLGGATSSQPILAQIAFVSFATTSSTFDPPSGFNRVKLTTWGACYLTPPSLPNAMSVCKPFEHGLFYKTFSLMPTSLVGESSKIVNGKSLDPADVVPFLPFTVNPIAFLTLTLALPLTLLTALSSGAVLYLLRTSATSAASESPYRRTRFQSASSLSSLSRTTLVLSSLSTFALAVSLGTNLMSASALNTLITRDLTRLNITTTVSLYGPGFLGSAVVLALCALWVGVRGMFLVRKEAQERDLAEIEEEGRDGSKLDLDLREDIRGGVSQRVRTRGVASVGESGDSPVPLLSPYADASYRLQQEAAFEQQQQQQQQQQQYYMQQEQYYYQQQQQQQPVYLQEGSAPPPTYKSNVSVSDSRYYDESIRNDTDSSIFSMAQPSGGGSGAGGSAQGARWEQPSSSSQAGLVNSNGQQLTAAQIAYRQAYGL
ncbi:hypothetical protein HDU78_005036 [Chytriomyces hyalinus]|nr:hypothetical protein HDU78_005036 [Chytriomyces hyalinus]